MSKHFFWVFLLCTLTGFSQQTAIYLDPERSYWLGLELFNKQKFGSAQKEFQKILETKSNVSFEARSNSEFYAARCASELFHPDAEYLLLGFISHYPESPNYEPAVYELGNYYYRLKKYKKAVEWLAKVDMSGFDKSRQDEINFKIGYCQYMTNDFDRAMRSFYPVKDGDSKYATAAQYYYAHISYVNGNYETALQEFMKLKNSEAFAPVAPYYITQIYYKQGKYDELLKFAPSLLDTAGTRNGLEISRMVAESYYRKGNYAEAIPHLLDYERNSPNAGRAEFYQIAFSYYQTKEFTKAIPYFQKSTSPADSLAQNAYYHLAGCYLNTGNKRNARTAFQSAAKINSDPEIQEISQFNFAKLSYELAYQSAAIEAFNNFIKKFPNSAHFDEANELLVGIYAGTRNYKDALTALESIRTTNPSIRAAYQKVAYYRGVELFMDQRYKDAIQLFNTSLAHVAEPGLAAAAGYWKGEAYYKLGQYDDAIKSYNDFIFAPAASNLEYYNLVNYNLGYAYFKKEDYANSQTAFRKYTKEKSQSDPERFNDALLRIGDCFFMLKDQLNAMDYYNQAIASNARSSDYAIVQKALILGIQGKMTEKVSALQKIFEKYPRSVYVDDALYEAAQASMIDGNNTLARKYYHRIIDEFPTSSYVKKAELGEALVFYNDKEDDQAIAAYRKIVSKYPNTVESREALMQLKNIAISKNKVNEYLEYAKNVPNADVSQAAQDSLNYEAAELRYTQGKCDEAIKDFNDYLQRFPDAIFRVNASFYKSDCLFRDKQYEQALAGYDYVISQPKSLFTEKSLLNAGLINYRLKQYEIAFRDFKNLEATAEVKDNLMAAQAGQMRSSYQMNDYDLALKCAAKVLSSGTADKDLLNEAHLISGRIYFSKDDLTKAKEELSIVAKRTNSEMTAESRYHLAVIEYKLANYKESQKLIFEIQNQIPGYDFWIAKGFILLGDNYLAQKDTFQAKETYKSIQDNYQKDPADPEDLKSKATQKLSLLSDAEQTRDHEIMEQKLKMNPEDIDSTGITPKK